MFKINDKINYWTILEDLSKKNKVYGHLCKCECGKIKWVSRSHLSKNKSTSCGCKNLKNLSGKRFGKLKVIKYSHTKERGIKYKRTDRYWLCLCDCGKETYKRASDLKKGKMSSCGCYLKQKVEYGLSSKKVLYNTYVKLCAKKRGYKFDIAFSDFIAITSQDCYYCGRKPESIIKNPRGNGDYYYNGLDRINNDLGYTIKNVVPCCNKCNVARNNMTQPEFVAWIKSAYIFLSKESFYGY